MQAIVVKYLPATNTKGTRLKATCKSGSVTVGYPYGLGGSEGLRFAADALCAKLHWNRQYLVQGTLPNGDEVFVFRGL
jgi:hypothetical protein